LISPGREGDAVAKDEQIAHIVSESLESEVRVAVADVEISQEQLGIGKRSMDSAIREYRTLQDLYYSRGIAAGKEVDRTELEMQRAINSQRQNEINLEKAQSRLSTLRAREERLSIRSPYDGLIVSKATLEGTNGITKSFGRETITDFDGRMVGAEFSVAGRRRCERDARAHRCDIEGHFAHPRGPEITRHILRNDGLRRRRNRAVDLERR
jgi:hypothetical protein